MADNKTERWTEIEHLPEWDEEFYEVYTAKKHGKWVMLKTLRPELRDDPAAKAMIEKEFDVRYNLAHPAIIMINDFEEVPGVGLSIITDDVYGDSLRKLIDRGEVTDRMKEQILTRLVDAIDYIQTNHIEHHPIRPETIIFTENVRNLKVIDVGFDQRSHLKQWETSEDIYNFGKVLQEVLDATGDNSPRLRHIAARCMDENPARRYRDVHQLRLSISGDSNRGLMWLIIAFLSLMVVVLTWLIVKHPGA